MLYLEVRNFTMLYNKFNLERKLFQISDILESNMLTLSFKLEDIINAIMFTKTNGLHP